MTIGSTPVQPDVLKDTAFVSDRISKDSIFAVLRREGRRQFPDEMFADLYESAGRRSVRPHIMAPVMMLQHLHGLSDRDAVEAFEFDVCWKYACGGLDVD